MGPIPDCHMTDLILDNMVTPIPDHTMGPIPDCHMTDLILDNMVTPIPDHTMGPIPDCHMTDLILDNMTPIPDHTVDPIPDHMTGLILDNMMTLIPDHTMDPILDHTTGLILDNMMTLCPDHMMAPILDHMPHISNRTRVLIPDQNTEVVIPGGITETANSLLGDKQVPLIFQVAVVVIIGEETEDDMTITKMKIITAINQHKITAITGIEIQKQSL